ncbi:MAG: OmpA family protein [Pseudomonadales bacterium]|nr:OmpA family protein [Pseudomonadales bacterium]
MFRSLLTAAAMLIILPVSAQTPSLPDEGPYFRLSSGSSIAAKNSYNLRVDGIDVESDHKSSWAMSGAIGTDYGRFRTEFEIGILRNNIDFFDITAGGGLLPVGRGIEGKGRTQAITFMSNGYYDFDDVWGFKPYVGMGAGWAYLDFNRYRIGDTEFLDDHDGEFAYQALAGLRKTVASRWVLDLGYRFIDTPRARVQGAFESPQRPDLTTHSLQLGLSYHFGALTPRPRTQTPVSVPTQAPAVSDADRDGVPDDNDRCPDTPTNYAVDDDGCPIPSEEVARIELDVKFDFDRATVKQAFYPEIGRVAQFLDTYPNTTARLEGHTDSIGTVEYNQGLSERRVNAIRRVLIDEYGITAGRITTQGLGENQPVATNDTAEGRAQNRRVVSVIEAVLIRYETR